MLKRHLFSFLSILFVLILLAVSHGLYGQPGHLKFVQLTVDDGLSSSIVSSIIQDHKGFIWIGTTDGLNRYDGYKFVIYKNTPDDAASLCDNVVLSILEDHNKDLWIGTENGLCEYNRNNDSFHNFFLDKSSPLYGLACGVNNIIEDNKNNLWLATSVGLVYFDRQNKKIVQFTHNPSNYESISDDNVESLLIDKDGRLWVTTLKGLNLYLPDSRTFKHFDSSVCGNEDLSQSALRNIIEDRDGNLWIGSRDGLYCMNFTLQGKLAKLVHYKHNNLDPASLSIDQVKSLFVDNTDRLWVGTENGGINLFDRLNGTFLHYRKDDYDPQSLSNESIEDIFQDKAGNLWFATYTGGVNISLKNRDAIIKYQNLPGAPLSLSHNTVTCFLEDPSGRVWIGTDGGGLDLFNSLDNRFKRFNSDNSGLTSNSILCLSEDADNQIWIGTWAGGLVSYNHSSGTFRSWTTKNSGINDDNIFAVEEGYSNDLWLGSFEHGLIHYNKSDNTFKIYSSANSGLGDNMVLKIVKYSENKLLIGTTTGLQIFSTIDGSFSTYLSGSDKKNGLSFPRVTEILPENDSIIWIGTPYGLNRFNPVNGHFVRYFESDGLPDNYINGLVFDKKGLLWITTNKGICRFDYRNNSFKNFTKADGLQSNQFSERSVLRTKSGVLFLGGIKGFNIIYPENISENTTVPDILITDFQIFNKSIKPGDKNSPLARNITETESITLSHDNSVLTFSFAAMDFSAPEKNKYAYMMENFDNNWIYTENKREATYTNLNPGTYIFHVKGSNNDSVWNETGTAVKIIILPPFWDTWWFKLICVTFILLTFTLFYLTRVRQLKSQQLLLENTVASKTAELKELNASKDKFFSIIAHDLKNPFNTIIGFSELLKEENDPENTSKSKEYARAINKSAVQTLSLLENLLEWANSQRGSISFIPSKFGFYDLLQEEFSFINAMAAEKNITMKMSIPDNLTIFGDINMIRTIMRNLLSNAVKFTNRNGVVEVKASEIKEAVEIGVYDNGTGISAEVMDRLFKIDGNFSTRGTEDEKGTGIGLILCKEFVKKHGGEIWVESEKGRGSAFKFVIPSKINEIDHSKVTPVS